MTTKTKLNLDHMTQEVAAMVRDYISQTKLIQQKIDEYCEDEGLDMENDEFIFEMDFPFTIKEKVYYTFTTLVESGCYDHLNTYSVEGDYSTTINKELVEQIHKEGKLDHQELNEIISVERRDALGKSLELNEEVHSWYN